jgi:hypothetical protein
MPSRKPIFLLGAREDGPMTRLAVTTYRVDGIYRVFPKQYITYAQRRAGRKSRRPIGIHTWKVHFDKYAPHGVTSY